MPGGPNNVAASDSLNDRQFPYRGRPTPKLNAAINNLLSGTDYPDNPGPMIVAQHRDVRDFVKNLPESHFDLSDPSGIGFAAYEAVDRAKNLTDLTSDIINTAFRSRSAFRNDINATKIASANKKRASEDTYNPNEK